MDIFFKSPEHKQRLLAVMQKIGKVYGGKLDEEYAAALYILTADYSTWDQAKRYISPTGIDFSTMLKDIHTGGAYFVIIQLAGNLFNGNEHIDPLQFMRLDDNNFRVALDAIRIRRYSLHTNELKGQ